MTSDITLSPKDSVRLPFLRALLSGCIGLSVGCGSSSPVDYRTAIHRDGCRVSVFEGCNFTEDTAADLLTVRPSALRETLTLTFTAENKTYDGTAAADAALAGMTGSRRCSPDC